jgi:type IV secretory pathway VirB2 component (pilin)
MTPRLKPLLARRHQAAAALALTAMTSPAFAQLGGLQKATTTAQDVTTGVYAFVGACAGLYLLYLCIMAFMERKQWSDVFMGVVHVAIAGGSVVLGAWAWAWATGS